MQLVFILLLLWVQYSWAESDTNSQLSVIRNFKCQLNISTEGMFDKDNYKIKNGMGLGSDYIYFSSINLNNHTATEIGNMGSSPLKVFLTSSGLNFIEITPSGNFVLTTIFDVSKDGVNFPAVMSRHMELMPGMIITSQNFGICKKWD